ncbi:hypothetical protein N9934_05410, partial [Desulfosarcina sp.]|nr:hypothetical protein [Desulfosarcina sp.]
MANIGMCGKCEKPVPVKHYQKDGKEYLEKSCPDCGTTSALLSNDIQQYHRKRNFMSGRDYPGCDMECRHCT